MSTEDKAAQSIEKARSDGWVPLEEWTESGRAEGDWVDHQEFNFRGELMSRISSQTQEMKRRDAAYDNRLKNLQGMMEDLIGQNKKLALDRIKEERKDLRQLRSEALAENDHETVASIDEDLDDLNKAQEELADAGENNQQQSEGEFVMTPEDQATYQQWVQDNPWYVTNPQAANYASFVAQTLDRNSMGWGDYLNAISDAVGAVFQEGTQSAEPKRNGAMGANAEGGRGPKKGSPSASLTETEREIGKGFVAEGLFKNLDEYATSLQEG